MSRVASGDTPLRLGGYRLLRRIAAAPLRAVYQARREHDGLLLALKVVRLAGSGADENLARFSRSCAVLSRIHHPGLVRIHDHGFAEGHAYLAMEYCARGDLRAEIQAGVPRPRALQVLGQLARALAAVHARGILHRDLKPENVLVRADARVALADFGIASMLLQQDPATGAQAHPGEQIGTPYYVSPEQAAGKPLTPASDLYSLGVMLYELLAGQRPYRAESLQLLLAQHQDAPVPRLPQPHQDLQPLLERLMAKQPQDRFAGANALLQALSSLG